jgi:hypothetical protein
MTVMKRSSKSHQANPSHATNEGDEPMKTAIKSQAVSTTHVTTPTTSPSPATMAYIQTCTSLLDQLEAAFPQGDSLTAKDKRRLAKARKRSERYTPQLVALARQHGVNLALVPLDTISNASAEAAAVVSLQKRIEAMAARAASRTFALQSTAWSGSSKLYAVMKRLSRDSGDLETGLAPVEQFFNHRHPLVAKNHPKTKKGRAALAAEKAAGTEKSVGAPVGAPTQTQTPAAPPSTRCAATA